MKLPLYKNRASVKSIFFIINVTFYKPESSLVKSILYQSTLLYQVHFYYTYYLEESKCICDVYHTLYEFLRKNVIFNYT